MYVIVNAKSQLISKWFGGHRFPPKKMNEQIWLYYYDTSGRLVFVRFLRKLTTPRNHFEIDWPLRDKKLTGKNIRNLSFKFLLKYQFLPLIIIDFTNKWKIFIFANIGSMGHICKSETLFWTFCSSFFHKLYIFVT